MRFYTTITIFTCLLLSSCLKTENTTEPKWYKGNLHTHSFWSDGDDFPEMIMDWYKSHNYDFIVLSDHNIIAEGEKWKLIPKARIYQNAFDRYLQKYGQDWVIYRKDSAGSLYVKLKTLEEYSPLFEKEDEFLIIQSEEISENFNGKPIHMNVTNIQELIIPQGGNSVVEVIQNNINAVLKQRNKTNTPMFLHINHPNFVWAISPDDMKQLTGERFFEVYNGHPAVNNYGDSLRPSMDALWDEVQVAYIKANKPLLYGLAVDDAHNYHVFDQEHSNAGRGWVMVKSNQLTPESIVTAMENGDFYATTGVLLKDIQFDGTTLEINILPEDGVNYIIQFFGAEKSGNSKLLKQVEGLTGSYALKQEDLFVRAKIISSKIKKNPYKIGDKEVAWTQPVTKN